MTNDPDTTALSVDELMELTRPLDEDIPANRRLDFTWAVAPEGSATVPPAPAAAPAGESVASFFDNPAPHVEVDAEDEEGTPRAATRYPDEMYGSEFSNLVIDGMVRSGAKVAVNRTHPTVGLQWLDRDEEKVGLSIDRGLRAILNSVSNELLVKPSALVEALIVLMAGQLLGENDRMRWSTNLPRFKTLVTAALEGKADWADPDDDDPDAFTRDQYIDLWMEFWNHVWSQEFYEEHASYKLALKPWHNYQLRRLAKQKDVSKARLLADIIEALAERDLGVRPPDSAKPSDD